MAVDFIMSVDTHVVPPFICQPVLFLQVDIIQNPAGEMLYKCKDLRDEVPAMQIVMHGSNCTHTIIAPLKPFLV